MYAAHFGLRELPFGITPDTSFFFGSPRSQEALNTLLVATGWIAPAPMPWIARATMRAGMLQAIPHSTEPIAKTAMPNRTRRLRPKRSASLP